MTPSDTARLVCFEAAVGDLMALRDDPALAAYRNVAVGAVIPFLPSPASMTTAAWTLEQVVRVLRHHAIALELGE